MIAATKTSSELFNRGARFVEMLRARGLGYRNDPVAQSLRRLAVYGVMNRSVVITEQRLNTEQVETLLENKPQWILIKEDDETMPQTLMPAAELARHMEERDDDKEDVDLQEIPAERLQATPVAYQATLQEGWELLQSSHSEALYVVRDTLTRQPTIFGILSREDIEANYLYNGQ